MKKIISNQKKAIIIPLLGAKYHGGVRIIFLIANYLASKKLKVVIVCNKQNWDPIYPLSKSVNVKLIQSKYFLVYILKLFYFFIKNQNKKSIIILSHWITGLIFSFVPKSLRNKSIYFVQDSEEVFYTKKNFFGKILRFWVFYSYKNASDNFIVTTKYGYNKLKVIVKNKFSKINLNPLGIDKKQFFFDKDIEKQNKIIFFPRKGWFKDFNLLKEILINLLNNRNLNNFEFVLISQEYQLKKILPKSKRIKFFSVNSDSDLRRIYNEAKLLVHTSRYEGICLPILEAMMCGTFVFFTNSFGPLTYANNQNSKVFVIRDKKSISKEIENFLLNFKDNSDKISGSVSLYSLDTFLKSFTKNIEEII